MATLNSNPEILLRKRRNAERTRVEKQEAARRRAEAEVRQRRARQHKFVRAEALVASTLATEREKTRIQRVSKRAAKQRAGHVTGGEWLVRVRAAADGGLEREKTAYDGRATLLFVVRVRGPAAAKIPRKAHRVLTLLRLAEVNTGVFVRLTAEVFPLLQVVAPYVVVGRPSLASIRALVQKRARVVHQRAGEAAPVEMVLNDNGVVEERLGDEGVICVEDIIHEIATMGEAFAKCNFFLLPFKLGREVSGFSALSRLQKLKQREEASQTRPVSNAAAAPLVEVDVDELIGRLN
ncbi:AAL011Cp [Eremothecium gossypii ATCC 10895]|uniref:Ribosome biogenesis protein RLP7 n=1 Tax=Eremothecium gossypii (strain ATCC 10895 / CBS 109.51 / FGSC 9923 / NRRL Y-1056) TaxID=284811 RepID=RLP7_EREGS|nr:AAL011Cp [Eremothecium gossypii ATCC 10895]Q75ET5.1 RecName: Full=Ribosome biogenesis protein RLP7 [Eremothecium gossypii ATCC 10895]AAS50355.1 AAL011Cp [Eremothecium gossypii ATCC 10895]AEY94641.1 FAAL011Cp [Eremothecium gossypii FDAG1]